MTTKCFPHYFPFKKRRKKMWKIKFLARFQCCISDTWNSSAFIIRIFLTHFMPLGLFLTAWKHQKTRGLVLLCPLRHLQDLLLSKMSVQIPAGICLFKVYNWSTRARPEICWRHSGVFIVNFEHILHLLLGNCGFGHIYWRNP